MNRGLGIGAEDSSESVSLRTPKGLDPAGTIKRLSATLQALDRLKAERNSYQAQNSALQLECERLLEQRQGSLQEENQKLREQVIHLENEREGLLLTLKDFESSDQVASLRAFSQLKREKEALEADLLQARLSTEALRQEGLQITAEVTTLELERKELLGKLAGYIQRDADLTREKAENKEIHMRHSRLLASVILIERTSAYVRRLKSQFWSNLSLNSRFKPTFSAGFRVLRTAIAQKSRLNLRRKLLFWWEGTVRSKGEMDKSALFHGFETRINRQSLFAAWSRLTASSKEENRKREHKGLLRSFITRLVGNKEEKMREKRRMVSFAAWKGFYLSLKRDQFRSELASVAAHSEHLSAHLSGEQAQHQHTLTLKALKAMMRQSKGQCFAAFTTWKQVTGLMKAQAPKLSRVIMRWRRGNEGRAISTWKTVVGIGKLTVANERLAVLAAEVGKAKAFKANYCSTKMRRLFNFTFRYNLKSGLQTWSRQTHMTTNKRRSARKLWEWVRNYHLTVGWTLLVRKDQARKLMGNRLARLMVSGTEAKKKLLFRDWAQFAKTRKVARKVITKVLNLGNIEGKRKGLYTWKDNTAALREAESHSERTHLQRQLTETSLKLAHYHRTIQLKCLLLFERTVEDNSKLRLLTGFSLWKEQAETGRREREGTSRLMRLWNRHGLRKGVRSWVTGVRYREEMEWRERVNAAEKDLKEQKRTLKTQKESFEEKLGLQDQALESSKSQLLASKQQFQSLFEMFAKAKQFSQLTRKLCFKSWRKSIQSSRKAYQFLLNVLQRRILQQSLQAIKQYSREIRKQAWLQRCIHSLVQDFRTFSLRGYTVQWRTIARLAREEELQGALQREQQAKALKSQASSMVADRFSQQMMLVSDKFVKLKVVQTWKKDANRRSKLRSAEYNLALFRQEIALKRALARLKGNLKQRKYRQIRHSKVVTVMTGYMAKEIFRAWASRCGSLRHLTKSLRRVYHSLYFPIIWRAFESIRRQGIVSAQQFQASQHLQSSSMTRVITAMLKSKLNIGFSTWRFKTVQYAKYRKSLRKATLGMVKRGLRAAWNSWNLQIRLEREKLQQEQSGSAARAREALVEKILILRKLLIKERIDLRKVEKYILERESKGSAVVSLWTGAELTGKERFFKMWKLLFVRRRNIQRAVRHIRAFRRSPDLIHGFLAWKRHLLRYSPEVTRASKAQLAAFLTTRDKDLTAVFNAYQEESAKKADLEQSCDLLVSLVRKGQNQALSLLISRIHIPLLQGLTRWSRLAKSSHIHYLLAHSDKLQSDLTAASSYIHKVTSESRSLSVENEELRRSAADGMAFAEALEEVGQENRDLRLELQERGETVQRLVRENEALAMGLRRVKAGEEGSHRRVGSGSMRLWQS